MRTYYLELRMSKKLAPILFDEDDQEATRARLRRSGSKGNSHSWASIRRKCSQQVAGKNLRIALPPRENCAFVTGSSGKRCAAQIFVDYLCPHVIKSMTERSLV